MPLQAEEVHGLQRDLADYVTSFMEPQTIEAAVPVLQQVQHLEKGRFVDSTTRCHRRRILPMLAEVFAAVLFSLGRTWPWRLVCLGIPMGGIGAKEMGLVPFAGYTREMELAKRPPV